MAKEIKGLEAQWESKENVPGSEKAKKTYKKELLNEIEKTESKEEVKTTSPFPQHKWYTEVWNSLTPEQQKEMKENIRITSDGKIEIIKMKKKFFILTAEPNNEDIFDWSHVDKYGNSGIKWVTYLTWIVAEHEVKKQWKKLLKNWELGKFISFFPWEETYGWKIYNFLKIIGLEKAGCWDPFTKSWFSVGSLSKVGLSGVDEDDDVAEVKWYTDIATIGRGGQEWSSPFLAFEDC